MKKLKLLLLTFFFSSLMHGVYGQQDTIKGLIFSEFRAEIPQELYIELANVGNDPIDLSRVTLACPTNAVFAVDAITGEWSIPAGINNDQFKMNLSGTLDPGDTYLIQNVSDKVAVTGRRLHPWHRLDLLEIADTINHSFDGPGGTNTDTIIPEWEVWGFDSIDINSMFWNYGNQGYIIYDHLANGDSVLLDQVNVTINDGLKCVRNYSEVAGISDDSWGTRFYTLVRKASVKQGNMNWEKARGTSAEDSEWLVIPNQGNSRMSYTTAKTHGVFNLDVSSTIADVDIANMKITVPWGVNRGDSILSLLDVGPGQAWEYRLSPSLEDSTHTMVTSGDVLTIYTVGNSLTVNDFELAVVDPSNDQASVFPIRFKVPDSTYYVNPVTFQYTWNENASWFQPYYVTEGDPVIDTIGNVPYATRVDTLFKYLEKAPLANWEIVWKDGEVRADLQNGDKLKVTAENGTTVKEYFIDVQEYAPSDNTNLSAITWPDKAEFLEGWTGDTIPQFSSSKYSYTVMVPYGSTNVPALVPHPANLNSKISTKRAMSLTGSFADRTTVFTVTSESDTLSQDYTVIFELEKDPSKIQDYEGTPIISEIIANAFSWLGVLEIANPGTVEMDLSEYLILRSDATSQADALAEITYDPLTVADTDFPLRYRGYVPGYKYADDTVSWLANPGILSLDASVDPIIEPGGVFVMSAAASNRVSRYTDAVLEVIDKRWDQANGSPLTADYVNYQQTPPLLPRGADALWVFHIENDSVLEGTKPVGDPNDYKVVDVMGDFISDDTWNIAGIKWASNSRGRIQRKPDVYTGSKSIFESVEAFGTSEDTSEYIISGFGTNVNFDPIGSHTMDPVTAYISKVTSPVYLVSDGYGPGQSIQGDLTGTTVDQFMANLEKADPGQTLSIHADGTGNVKDGSDAVATNDTLIVASADSLNFSMYALIDLPLSSDAVLTTEDANITISTADTTGSIAGVEFGSLLKDLVPKLKVPDFALMSIINSDGELVPMQRLAPDTTMADTKVGDDIYFEVKAQDKVTVITYKLEPATESSDAYVISSFYDVDQDNNNIEGVIEGTSTALFFKNIEVVKGAKAKLLNKLGNERLDGKVSNDDVLQVESEDGTVTRTYFITFLHETTPDSNGAPEITLAFSDSTISEQPGTLMLSATADDDGLPPPANLTYLWEVTSDNAADASIETPSALETNVTFSAKGDYTITLSVSDGALTSTETVNVTVGIVGVENVLMSAMRLYPNPAKDRLTLEMSNMPAGDAVLKIFNTTGSAVYSEMLSSEKTEIDINSFDSGLYFIKVTYGNQSFVQRVQIQK